MKKKMRLKPYVLPTLYLIMVTLLMMLTTVNYERTQEENLTYVSSAILSNDTPVVSTPSTSILRPVASSNVTIAKQFYDANSELKDQENALIYYEGTYIQNSGIDYTSEEKFQIVSILDGTVTNISENELLGKTIEIKHDNDLISVYQCLDDVNVTLNQTIRQGNVIANSGSCKINVASKNNLHFELFHNGAIVNPEKYFGKSLKDITE